MTDTFSPSINPSVSGTSATDTPRVRMAQFGDGYSQRAADGLNYKDRVAALNWGMLDQTKFDELNDFFENHSGGTAFIYTLPMESVAMKWMWTSKAPGYVDGLINSLRVDIKRVFDL